MISRIFRWFSRITPKNLPSWFGWGVAKGVYNDCREIGGKDGARGFFSRRKELYRENLRLEHELQGIPFEDRLARWGIETEEDLARAVRDFRRARVAGVLLTLLMGAFCFWQLFILSQSAWWKTLHGIAGLSILAVGIIRWVTASWRLQVFKHKKFIPFLRWLTQLGNVKWQDEQQ